MSQYSTANKQHFSSSIVILPCSAIVCLQNNTIDYLQYPLELNQFDVCVYVLESFLLLSIIPKNRKRILFTNSTHGNGLCSILMYTNIFHRDQHNYCVCTQEERERRRRKKRKVIPPIIERHC